MRQSGRLYVVMIEALPDQGDGTDDLYRTYHLDPEPAIGESFRRGLMATVRQMRRDEDRAEPYEVGWVPTEGELAVAGLDVIEPSPLLDAVEDGLAPERAGLPAPGPDEEGAPGLRPARGYAVVFGDPAAPDDFAYLLRRQDPVSRLTRNRIVAAVSATRLTETERILTFDSGIDVVVWRQRVVIRSVSAFEALFFPAAVRRDVAERVARALDARISVRNVDLLVETARGDSVFASRLRRLERSERLATTSSGQLLRSATEFGLHRQLMPDGQLQFRSEGNWRWRFLEVLEDAFLASPGSGRQYRSGSQKTWVHRRVDAVQHVNGEVRWLCGEGWGRITVDAVSVQLRRVQAAYYVDSDGERVYLTHSGSGHGLEAVRDGTNVLAMLPECPEPE